MWERSEGIGHAAHAHDHHVEVVVVAGMLSFRMQPRVERFQDVVGGDDAFVVFWIVQALHDGRNDVAAAPVNLGVVETPLGNCRKS